MISNTKILTLAAISLFCCACGIAQDPQRTIEIHAHRYAFSPADITIKKGESVRLRQVVDDVLIDVLIKALLVYHKGTE